MTRRKTIVTCLLAVFSAATVFGQYKVRQGDTLEKIAKKQGVSVAQLKAANSLSNPNALKLGQSLVIPGKAAAKAPAKSTKPAASVKSASNSSHAVVAQGQNAGKIAKAHGLTLNELKALNPGVNLDKLQIGQKLALKKASTPRVVAMPAKGTIKKLSPPKPIVAKKASTNKGLDARFVAIKSDSVNVRQTPATSGKRIALVREGSLARVIETRNDWRKVQFAGGTIGWVRSDFLAASTESSYQRVAQLAKTRKSTRRTGVVAQKVDRQDLLGFAKNMLGTRYRYGAMSRSATDCSGFTCQVFRSQGITLPRTSAAQSQVGALVPRSQLKAGDLVFFRTRGGARVSHVGIYIGSGQFIHASTTGREVRIDRMDASYYRSRYVTARRVGNFDVEKKSIAVTYNEDREMEFDSEVDSIPVIEPEPLRGFDGVDN